MEIENILSQSRFTSKIINPSTCVFKEGEDLEGVYYIKAGKIKVTKSAKHNVALWFAYPGEFLGVHSYFNGSQKYTCSSFAHEDEVELIYISLKDFDALLAEHPEFKEIIIQMLCNRICYTRKRISHIKSQNIRNRFLNSILLFIDQKDIQNTYVKLKCSIDDLSELTGASKPYIQKLIKEFNQKKLLQLQANNMMLVDLGQLMKYIG